MIDEENQHESVQNSASDSSASSVSAGDAASPEGDFAAESAIDPTLAATTIDDGVTVPPETVQATVVDQEPGAPEGSALLGEKDNEIKLLKAQLEERTNQCVRIAADFDNYRKRTQREREDLELQVKCSTINELLPVVDNFERARSQIKPQTDQETTIHKSYQSVYKQLVDCLKRIGVAPMRSEGKEFDPSFHEAVMRQPTDEHPEGTVIEELVRGYVLGERVLRHALVKVAAPPEPVITSEESDQSGAQN
ncbi:nucleotide exchange factor GrpE [Stenomitos frigidus]|uniref:Protein GrpE n=1 Tax=Stenomitos frigidus ULC18 TaxID=2107698 RepID=A0A2T1E4T5_9CYAN|nr:nucleotide exchange factor GrpE [Stenomitos frigidus]PSB27772.1 nucleotide exchange factor GrpE [Stenomitos frigidus ULC18]